jgi:sugar phosphate isomerase/epimerase
VKKAGTRVNRRTAIRTLLASGAIPWLGCTAFTQGARRRAPARLGLAMYTVRVLARRDFEGTLRAIADIGYRDLDMYPDVSGLPPKETRALLDRAGLVCRSARLATPALRADFERTLETANVLGARWVTLANVPPAERASMRDWERLVPVFNRAGESARRAGLTFCYHNHDFELHPLEGRVPLDFVLAATDAELFRLQMDVYWMTKGGRNAAEEIRRLGGRVASLHLKDMEATPERGITSVGRGTIDFTAVLRAARDAGVADVFVEEDDPSNPLSAIRGSYTHLAQIDY